MKFALFEKDTDHRNLYPITHTRPIGEIRLGVLTIREKWETVLNDFNGYVTAEYLKEKFPFHSGSGQQLFINSSFLPNRALCEEINSLDVGDALYADSEIVACIASDHNWERSDFNKKPIRSLAKKINYLWDLIDVIPEQIGFDFDLLRKQGVSGLVNDPHTVIYGDALIVEEGAEIRNASINTELGPVYIGQDAVINEGSIIHGPAVIGKGAELNLGAKVRSNVVIGPYSKVGGEIAKSIILGYTNKAHDGYLGNSVLGEWCNLGADTNSSNMKNNYGNVRVWNYTSNSFIDSGQQFCGLLMGDHSKAGINTMFNTGTVVGVSSSVFGGGFPRKHVPPFTWGGLETGSVTYDLNKAMETAAQAMKRRGLDFSDADKSIFTHVYNDSDHLRNFK